MIQHVGLRRQNDVERIPIAAKIGNQHFDFASGDAIANFFDGARENVRAAVFLIVAIHGSDDRVAQTHARDGFGDAQRLFFIRRADGLA